MLQNLRVPTASGDAVPLSAVADIAFGAGPSQIDRLDRARNATISAELDGMTLGQANQAVKALPTLRPKKPAMGLSERLMPLSIVGERSNANLPSRVRPLKPSRAPSSTWSLAPKRTPPSTIG